MRIGIIVLILAGIFLSFFIRKSPLTKQEKIEKWQAPVDRSDSSAYFHGIPLDGIGGDPILNRQKNRTTEPPKIETYSIAQVLAIPSSRLAGTQDSLRSGWDPEAKAYAAKWESKGIQVEGYLIKARESGKESANGYSEKYCDMHLWIVGEKNDRRDLSVLAEVTPRWAWKRPSWTVDNLARLAGHKTRVRITGWLLWDEEHPDEVGKSRGTQWEIHPITKIEVFSSGNWKEY